MRIIAFDIGDKWIGVAHSDFSQSIVFPYATWKVEFFEKEFNNYLINNKIELIIVGIPKTMQGNNSEQTNKVLLWLEDIKAKYKNITFHLQDERLSSKFAKKILSTNKSKKNSDHTIAASIILENFLLYHKSKN